MQIEPTMLLVLLAALPFVALPFLSFAAQISRRAGAIMAAAAMFAGLATAIALAPAIMDGGAIIVHQPWLTQWGLDLALRFDGLSLLFVVLINGIGLLIVLYAYYYMPTHDQLRRFHLILLAFAGGMLGIAVSENILLMLIFWEITSLTSFFLIAYRFRDKEARVASRMALAVTGGGGLALMAGLILLGKITGSFALTDILNSGDTIRAHPHYPAMLVLLLLGAFTKSAQFPFHFWLPNAMAAPTPVSAYLHSATMVKAGIFLLARLYPALSGTELWFLLVTTTGAITFLLGAYFAILKNDFKGLLAYSTISHLGLITLLLGLGTPLSPVAALFHIINHAVFKASLFMSAGIIDHECGTRDMRRINGLMRYMPITATLGILAAGAMAGIPFLNGFLSKEMFFAEALAQPTSAGISALVLPFIAVLGGILSVAYSLRFVHEVFFNGQPVDLPRTPHEPVRWMRLPVEILVVMVIAVGLLPNLVVAPLLHAASTAVLNGSPPPYRLALWHGLTPALLMSAIALIGGVLYYLRREKLFRLHARIPLEISSPVAFERVYAALTANARKIMIKLDQGTLRANLILYIGFTLIAVMWAAGSIPALTGPIPISPVDPVITFCALLLLTGTAGVVVLHKKRLQAIIFLSLTGLMVSLGFLYFGAPDLALTQLSVEVAMILLLLLALKRLPKQAKAEQRKAPIWRDAILAISIGLGVAAFALAMLTRPFETISGGHIALSKPMGGGTNVVNVILVDFRGFDTMGEIAVLGMAALGISALLANSKAAKPARNSAPPVMLQMLAQPLLTMALTVAIYLFLRGHNLPGGGFVGGLVVGIAFILQYLATDISTNKDGINLNPATMIGAGLAIATLTGAASWIVGYPFLTSSFTPIEWPLGHVELASAAAFDLGIMVLVVGVVLLIIREFAPRYEGARTWK